METKGGNRFYSSADYLPDLQGDLKTSIFFIIELPATAELNVC